MLHCLVLWLIAVKCIAENQGNSESLSNNDPIKGIAKAACNSSDSSQIEEAANSMFEEYWQIFLMMNPDYATALGDQRYDNKLGSYSLESIEKMKVIIEDFIERANRMLQRAAEGSETQNNLELFTTNLEYRLGQFTEGSYLFPISKLSTPEKNLRSLIQYMTLNSTQQFRNLIARYRAVPNQVSDS
ncbi:uncharacterized protein LOC118195840, partial [Stegodyphus dumicola]|uniref:uncharacterized protein LOC118195840 n=1 Tax=Stegodyphus dumicola TaxID=202533 RepID=UPI0015AF71DE